MAVKLVLFDMDDVLCRYDWQGFVDEFAALSGLSSDEVAARVYASGFDERVDLGHFTPQAHMAQLSELLGFSLDADLWVAARGRATHPWPDALALARRVAGKAQVAVFTNNSLLLGARIADIYPGLPGVFGARIATSAGLGLAKPDPAAFARCCAHFGAAAGETLFFDDKPENAAGACAAGLAGHRFHSVAQMARVCADAGLA